MQNCQSYPQPDLSSPCYQSGCGTVCPNGPPGGLVGGGRKHRGRGGRKQKGGNPTAIQLALSKPTGSSAPVRSFAEPMSEEFVQRNMGVTWATTGGAKKKKDKESSKEI